MGISLSGDDHHGSRRHIETLRFLDIAREMQQIEPARLGVRVSGPSGQSARRSPDWRLAHAAPFIRLPYDQAVGADGTRSSERRAVPRAVGRQASTIRKPGVVMRKTLRRKPPRRIARVASTRTAVTPVDPAYPFRKGPVLLATDGTEETDAPLIAARALAARLRLPHEVVSLLAPMPF